MAIYVDTLVQHAYRPTERFSGRWCHMTADERDELHDFAERLGLQRRWFQDHPTRWHYDITPTKRELALRLGAISVGRMHMGRIMLARRGQGD